jgi:hypothetical protein
MFARKETRKVTGEKLKSGSLFCAAFSNLAAWITKTRRRLEDGGIIVHATKKTFKRFVSSR